MACESRNSAPRPAATPAPSNRTVSSCSIGRVALTPTIPMLQTRPSMRPIAVNSPSALRVFTLATCAAAEHEGERHLSGVGREQQRAPERQVETQEAVFVSDGARHDRAAQQSARRAHRRIPHHGFELSGFDRCSIRHDGFLVRKACAILSHLRQLLNHGNGNGSTFRHST